MLGRRRGEEGPPAVKLAYNFVSPMALMIWAAIVIEGIMLDWADVGVLLALQILNAAHASVKRGGTYKTIDGAEVVVGDVVVLHGRRSRRLPPRAGAKELEIDQAALTGESMPVKMGPGCEPKMGSNCVRGEAEAVVVATGSQTFFGKTASMINKVQQTSHFDDVIMAITRSMLLASSVLVAISLVVLVCSGESWLEALAFAVVLLVASIPIALPVVSVTTMALGSRSLARKEAIVTRLSSIEEVAGMNVLCSDKTGTLTLNKMVLQDELPIFTPGYGKRDVLVHAALAAKWREPPKDALDTLVLGAADLDRCDAFDQPEYVPFDPRTKRTEATLVDKGSQETFKCSKGAPHVILALAEPPAAVRAAVEAEIETLSARGVRSLAVARTKPGDASRWDLLGILTFLDPPGPDTAATIARAEQLGVGVKMITGDHKAIAVDMAKQLKMGCRIEGAEGLPEFDVESGEIPQDLGDRYGAMIEAADGFAGVFPEHKFLIAGVGIAVSGSTDAARAASDIVLTNDGLSTIVDAIVISRTIFQRMKNYVVYRVACTTQLLLFFFITVCFVHPTGYGGWDDDTLDDEAQPPKVFKLPVVVLVLITILNDGTIISIAYDAVKPSKFPEKWRMPQTFAIAFILGGVACVSSLLLLHVMLDSRSDGSVWRASACRRCPTASSCAPCT
ncbi:hypothetical protein JL720_11249 [Aureococcus anophagefferens]|nr:hypothetical protein JL720_11249 [Aureococcus anophagefferens]